MNDFTKDKEHVRRMFDEITPTYDLLNHLFTVNLDKRWRRKAVLKIHDRTIKYDCILDLAAGTGDFMKEFLRLNPGRIYSVDLSYEMLRKNKTKIDLNNHLPVQADAASLPFRDNSFDVIGIAFGVRNFENIEICLKEIHRVLKDGGRFITIEMFGQGQAPSNSLFNYYFKRIIPTLGNLISRSRYAYNYLFDSVNKFMTVSQYSEMLFRNGFEAASSVNNFRKMVYTVCAVKGY